MKIYKNGGGGGSAPGTDTWTPQGVTQSTVGGLASGTNLGTSPITVESTLLQFLYPYTPPTVTLTSAPSSGVYEFGNPTGPVTLTATTVRHSNPITSVIFQRSNNGGAYTTIHTQAVPISGGGAEIYIDASGAGGFAATSYRSTVGDGTSTSNSNTRDYTYVYPFYYGVGAPGLSGAQVGALTKAVVIIGNYTRAFAPSSQVYYYAYPATYANLTSIIDGNGFNITADWTLRNPVVITGLDGTPQNYKVYEFNNLNSVSQNITFNF